MAIVSSYPKIVDPFKQGAHSGLNFAYGVGNVRADNVVVDVAAGIVALTDDTTNYIEITTAGVISTNTIGFTAGKTPLYTVVTVSSVISTVTDNRCFLSTGIQSGGGASVVDYTASITTTWTGTSAPYSQEITITGLGATDKPVIDIIPSGIYTTDIQMEADFSNIYRVVTSTDKITVYSHTITTSAIPIQIKVVK